MSYCCIMTLYFDPSVDSLNLMKIIDGTETKMWSFWPPEQRTLKFVRSFRQSSFVFYLNGNAIQDLVKRQALVRIYALSRMFIGDLSLLCMRNAPGRDDELFCSDHDIVLLFNRVYNQIRIQTPIGRANKSPRHSDIKAMSAQLNLRQI